MNRPVRRMIAVLICTLPACFGRSVWAEEPVPQELVYKGSVSAGATVDDRGLIVDETTPAERTGRWKLGFAATWSFSVRWEPVAATTPQNNLASSKTANSAAAKGKPQPSNTANSKPKSAEPSGSASSGIDTMNDSAGEEPTAGEELTDDEEELIKLTNAERKKRNLPELTADPALMKLARSHSAEMAKLNQIGHEAGGKSFSTRMADAQYKAFLAGENIARGQNSPQQAVSDWMDSPGHKENILRTEFTHIGVGIATSATGKQYWTQVFSRP